MMRTGSVERQEETEEGTKKEKEEEIKRTRQ